MRIILVLIFTLLAPSIVGASEKAYLIIRATVVDESKKQPTWFGLVRSDRNGGTHIKANQYIVDISPGSYRFNHIDFGKNMISGKGTQFFKKRVNLNFEAGNIYVIGHFKLSHVTHKKYEIEIDQQNAELIKLACLSSPEIFEKYPLANFKDNKKMKVDCENAAVKPI